MSTYEYMHIFASNRSTDVVRVRTRRGRIHGANRHWQRCCAHYLPCELFVWYQSNSQGQGQGHIRQPSQSQSPSRHCYCYPRCCSSHCIGGSHTSHPVQLLRLPQPVDISSRTGGSLSLDSDAARWCHSILMRLVLPGTHCHSILMRLPLRQPRPQPQVS
jgi:hypothetical protein